MKKILIPLIVFIILLGLLMASCDNLDQVVGTGNIVSKDFPYKDFNEVEISSAFQFEINQSNTFSVSTSIRENIIDRLDVYQNGKTLVVRLKPGIFSHSDAKAIINMPELNKLVVSGASKGSSKGFKSANRYDLTVSGASQLDMNMESGETRIDVSGASKVTGTLKSLDTRLTVSGASRCDINGSAGITEIEVSGASQVNSPDFLLQNANVNLSGASRATIYTRGTLNVDVSGASTLNYKGNPILSKVNVTGASKINSQ
jgi:hypothetical protein